MNKADYTRLEQVVRAALVKPAAERHVFVRRELSGHPRLTEFAMALLEAAERPSLLDEPVCRITFSDSEDRRDAGFRIGPYRIERRLGEGAHSVVFLAWRDDALRRPVAVKVLRSHLVSSQAADRFETEQRALAGLDHPGIVPVFDNGETEDGQPYYAMRLVEGEAITTRCATDRLSINERLALFVQLCDAVHHAHCAGVHHRDLKPSNVLVEQRDGKTIPVVIDFGVARLLEHDETDRTRMTADGQIIGTLSYIAPEQLRGDPVDQRVDVFALGAVLYELLSGHAPVPREDSLLDTYMARKEGRFPSLISADRRFRGDLDAIVRHATAANPNERYGSARRLAEDIERYIGHRPVKAARVGRVRRSFKWVRRHRRRVVAGSAVLILIGFFAGNALVVHERARRDRAAARDSAVFVSQTLLPRLESTLGGSGALSGVMDAVESSIAELASRYPNDRVILLSRAKILLTSGGLALESGQSDRAESVFKQAESITHRLGVRSPADIDIVRTLAESIVRLGDVEKERGRIPSALRRYSRAHEHILALHARHPENRDVLDDVCWSYQRIGYAQLHTGDEELASASFAEQMRIASELLELDPVNAASLHAYVTAALHRLENWRGPGQLDAALKLAGRADDSAQQLIEAEPNNAWYARRATRAAWRRAKLLLEAGELDTASAVLQRAHGSASRLLAIDPDQHGGALDLVRVTGLTMTLAHTRGDLTLAARIGHDLERTLEEHRNALERPDFLDGYYLTARAAIACDSGDLEEARSLTSRAVEVFRSGIQRDRVSASDGRMIVARLAYCVDLGLTEPGGVISLAERAASLAPGDALACTRLAALHHAAGDPESARSALGIARVRLDPADAVLAEEIRSLEARISR